MSRHLSVRVGSDLFEQLETHCRRSGESRSAATKRLLLEGLRMEDHPGIVFRSGPGGRRAGLAGGPDVWEVVRAIPDEQSGSQNRVDRIRDRTGLAADKVTTALRYYAEHGPEVDRWLRRLDEEAERAEVRWRRGQDCLVGEASP